MHTVYDNKRGDTELEIVEAILTKNPCYKTGRKIEVKGLMLHSVGCPQPSAKVFIHNWNREGCDNKCAHAFIDANSGIVYQTLPWNHRGRHCGRHPVTKESGNNSFIGIEMCEPYQIKYEKDFVISVDDSATRDAAAEFVKRTYNSAVNLFAKLCSEFLLDPLISIVSHKEGYEQGFASNKGDPEHLWRQLGLPYTMDVFRYQVKECMKNDEALTLRSKKSELTETTIRIDVENLRIRSGPGTDYDSIGKYTGRGLFVITEIQNGNGSKKGWGKLKSINGWVCLDYVIFTDKLEGE